MFETYVVIKVISKRKYEREEICGIIDKLIDCGFEDAAATEDGDGIEFEGAAAELEFLNSLVIEKAT